jgi:putative tricarboxylic transport membrane protein
MEAFQGVLYGFHVALQPINLLYCLLGVSIGTLVGVLPGIGVGATIAILLPSTYHIPPASGIIALAGIYYGAQYGGSTTSILVNIPGEVASVITCLDGYAMARKGRAGPALGIAAFASFVAGTLSVVGLSFMAPALAKVAFKFGPPEYFTLMVLGIVILTYLAHGSMIKALIMAAAGLICGTVGTDTITGVFRFSYGIQSLADGLGIVPAVMGLFGISEILLNLEQAPEKRDIFSARIKGLLPNKEDWKVSMGPMLRGSLLGFFVGIIPGGSAAMASLASYGIEKKISRHPERFGTGTIEGVAGPEAANNSAATGCFIPLLTMGIPTTAVMAILLGALMIYGLQPGPFLMQKSPDVFWGTIVSMYVGNAMLLVLNLPLIGMWVKILKIPYSLLFPLITLFCLIGSYSLGNNVVDGIIMLVFGIVGYLMKKFDYEAAPFLMAMVLGPMMERALRQSLILSRGSFAIFYSRPISACFLLVAIFLQLLPLITKRKRVSELPAE